MQRDRIALAAFLAGTVLAGGNAVGIRFSNRELEPFWGAGLRFLLAAGLLAAAMTILRLPFPRGRALLGAVLYGVLIFGGAFAFAYVALLRIHAGLGQTLLALVPLATLLLAVLQRQERLRAAPVAGTLLALLGIGIVFGVSGDETAPLLSLLAALGAVACFAQGTVVIRRFPPLHPVTLNAVGMATGAVFLLGLALLARDSIALPSHGETWLALAYMVVLGSGPVFVLYVVVVRLWSASRAAYSFVLIPIVTLLLSAWLDDEPVGAGLLVGGSLVLAGVYVGALRPVAVEARAAEPRGLHEGEESG